MKVASTIDFTFGLISLVMRHQENPTALARAIIIPADERRSVKSSSSFNVPPHVPVCLQTKMPRLVALFGKWHVKGRSHVISYRAMMIEFARISENALS
jgi:hypothetical protein